MTNNSSFKIFPTLLITFIFSSIYISCKKENKNNNLPPIAYVSLNSSMLQIDEIVTGLDVPWDIDASINNELWFTEQNGSVYHMDLKSTKRKKVLRVPDVLYKKSYGLLGMAVHPKQPFVFLHYTFTNSPDSLAQQIYSRLVRYTFKNDTLVEPKILLDNIPGNTYHNGSRIAIAPDNKLFLSLGDMGDSNRAQNDSVITGKILRLNLEGTIPEDNPIAGSPIWSRGHRNVQGLALNKKGMLYSSEHGPNNDDEINLIEANGNYGWPDVQGFCDTDQEKEYCAWTPTIAVAGLAYYENHPIKEWQNSLIVANLKGRALRVLKLADDGRQIESKHIFFQKKFGRIRDVSVAPNGDIYFATTNRDWHPRFQPWMYDSLPTGPDRILRLRTMDKNDELNPAIAVLKENPEPLELLSENWNPNLEEEFETGGKLYAQHCLSCHGPNGHGSEDLIPTLSNTDWVTGDKGRLIRTLLTGLSKPIEVNGKMYNQEMPSYAYLKDQELADILTYIRNSFNNESAGVIAGEVYEEREGLKRTAK